jgi:hypothetical protein
MRIALSDIESREKLFSDKRSQLVKDKIVYFGENNDYPIIMRNLVANSPTGMIVANVYAKYLIGQGFANGLNNYKIGIDAFGNDVTLFQLLRLFCYQIAIHQGAFIRISKNSSNQIGSLQVTDFSANRVRTPDDSGYFSQIVYNKNFGLSDYKEKNSKSYFVYSDNIDVFNSRLAKFDSIESYCGEVAYFALPSVTSSGVYPLSKFDSVYLDLDTEARFSLFKNTKTRFGFTDVTVVSVAGATTEEAQSAVVNEFTQSMGVDGSNMILLFDEVDAETNRVTEKHVNTSSIPSNLDAKLYEILEDRIANNIRKAGNMPAELIDYEKSKIGTTSGEALKQARKSYNDITEDDRASISAFFANLMKSFVDPAVANVTDWTIEPLTTAEPIDIEQKKQEGFVNLQTSKDGIVLIINLVGKVQTGQLNIDSAKNILVNLFGLSLEQTNNILSNGTN